MKFWQDFDGTGRPMTVRSNFSEDYRVINGLPINPYQVIIKNVIFTGISAM
jgi:vacuolar-type H+-ATPase subunit B/Vma2